MYETRDGAKSASLETEVFAQRYTLIVVDATVDTGYVGILSVES